MNDLESLLRKSKPENITTPEHQRRLEAKLRRRIEASDIEVLKLRIYLLILTASLALFIIASLLGSTTHSTLPQIPFYEFNYRYEYANLKLPSILANEPRRPSMPSSSREILVQYFQYRHEALLSCR